MQDPVSFLELGPLEGAVPGARLHARLVVQAWGFDDGFIERAELLVSDSLNLTCCSSCRFW